MKKIIFLITLGLALSACTKMPENEKPPKESTPEGVESATEEVPEEVPEEAPLSETLSDAEINALPNEASGWGFVKKKGAPAEFTALQRSVTEKYGCIYEGSADERVLYLTFDEGYENGYTEKILDVLSQKNVKAAFFITAPYLEQNFDLVKRMLDEGHIVGNHTVNHPNMPSLATAEAMQEEINAMDRRFYEAFGSHMTYFRPPEGVYSERSLAATNAAGCKTVLWSFAYRDWSRDEKNGADYAVGCVTPYFYNGCVLLLHAVSHDNAEALATIIDTAHSEGFSFKTLDEFK